MPEYLLPIVQPYDYEDILAFLARHATFGVEKVKNSIYYRYVPTTDSYFSLNITRKENHLKLITDSPIHGQNVLPNIKKLFDTEHDPNNLPISSGVRVVGAFDPFETALSIILGQLVSIKHATQKLEQLTRKYGTQLDEEVYIFPKAEDLQEREIEEIGITKNKAGAIRELSKMLMNGQLSFEEQDLAKVRQKLLAVKGIGVWTSELILMRCYGDKDAFPKNDLFIRKALEKLVDEQSWRGKRAYLAHYLWANAVKAK